MTEIRFYHLQRLQLKQALPGILTQAYKRNMRVVVRLNDKDQVGDMDKHLWTYNDHSFLPHGSAISASKTSAEQPIWLTDGDDNPNNATVLILAGGADQQDVSAYDLCCTIFDGNDPEALNAAREKWKTLKDSGATLSYYQQGENGGWQQKA